MAYEVIAGQGHVGLTEIYALAWSANHAADPDFNSVSGYTEILELDPESPVNVNFTEEFIAQRSANRMNIHRRDLVGQELVLDGVANVKNLYALAYVLGMINALIDDKTADDPTRLQLPIGGYRATSYYSFIIRQRHPDIADYWVGWHILKAQIRSNGAINLQAKDHQKIPFMIETVCEVGDDHDDVLAYPYEEYDDSNPVITSITPSGQGVGSMVTIYGTGFGHQQGSSTVVFYNAKPVVTVYHWSSTKVIVLIPADATTGNVVVTVGGVASDGVSYTI